MAGTGWESGTFLGVDFPVVSHMIADYHIWNVFHI